jgi:hypothetical protein
MSFDEVTLWLITAMSLTAVAFLFWTFLALVRTSRSAPFPIGTEQGASNSSPDAHSSI